MLAGILLASATATAFTMHKFTEATKTVTTAESMISGLDRLELALVDAETGQRGYIITGNDGYLRPYKTGVARVQDETANLFVLARFLPEVTERLREINAVTVAKLIELANTLEDRHTSFEAAQASVNTHLGMNIMYDFRTKTHDLIVYEQKEITRYHDIAQYTAMWAMISLILTLIFSFMIMAIMCKADKIAFEKN